MARPFGWLFLGEECFFFHEAVCTLGDDISIEADGDRCHLALIDFMYGGRIETLEYVVGLRWPVDFGDSPHDPETFAKSSLWIPGRILEVTDLRLEFEWYREDVRIAGIQLDLVAMTEQGDFCGEFAGWIECEVIETRQ